MKRIITAIALICLLSAAVSAQPAFNPKKYKNATKEQVTRVEPLSWWVGMKTDLQLMVQGKDIASAEVTIEGGSGVSVTLVHEGDSPNYMFIDVAIADDATPGTYYLVFKNGKKTFKYPYEIAAREEGSAERKSFTTADMVYLIMPDRFANGDPSNDSTDDTAENADRSNPGGRHGGDIQGVIDHLDYISDLGATYIWTTPFLEDNDPQGSYHGYAASDYYHIDSRFGSNELYRTFVEKAREKGLGVIMDIVPNHCSYVHWWMEDLPFQDWVHKFDTYTGTNVAFSTNMDPNASKKDLYIQESGWFVPTMVDMNLDNPYVLKYFVQWGVWWIEYSGLNGFRVDTYPYNEKLPASKWCEAIMNEYPNFNIVGECWTSSIPQLAYWQGGNANKDGFDSHLPSIMDFPLHDALRDALDEDYGGWGAGMSKVYDILSHDFVYHDLSKMLIFPGNHDTARIGDCVRKDPRALKIAMVMMATMRGIPQVFAGDELMFVSATPHNIGDHPGLRVDFPGGWEGDEIDLFTAEGRQAQAHNTDGLEVEKGQAADLFDYVSRLFQWRKTADVIHNGKTVHFMTRDNTYAYFRYDDDAVVFVYINNNLEPVNVPWSYYSEITEGLQGGVDVLSGEPFEVSDATVVAPKTALVVEYNK